ncbi:MAG: hypothetical protein WAO35_18555 [Terriglobia bacterium]
MAESCSAAEALQPLTFYKAAVRGDFREKMTAQVLKHRREDTLLNKLFETLSLATVLVVSVCGASPGGQAQAPGTKAGSEPINCRVIEAFDDGSLGVRAIIFHQRDKADGPRLGSLLTAHTGEQMELEMTGGRHYRTIVFRVKSAFGRGLALVPSTKLKIGAHDEFTLSLPREN